MRDQGDERTSFQTLIDMGKLPADALLSPSKMKEGFYSKTLQHALQFPSGDSSGGRCQGDELYFRSDEYAYNWLYESNGNQDGTKVDLIQELDIQDNVFIQGVSDSLINYEETTINLLGNSYSGIGIFAGDSLEALYTGSNLSMSQLDAATQGLG